MSWKRTRIRFFGVWGSRQIIALACVLVLIQGALPPLLVGGEPLYKGSTSESGEQEQLPEEDRDELVTASRDRGRAVRLKKEDGTVEELTMDAYLWGVVAAEMPASFQPEALKAQACAARTYTVTRQNSTSDKHPEADICADSSCCQAYVERSAALLRWGLNAAAYSEKIEQAVSGTDGLGILYQGSPIQALFFSSAPGRTVDAVEVWGNSVAYLKSVDSPEGEEVPNYHSQVVLSKEQVRELTLSAYPGADLSGDPSGWFGQTYTNEGGTVSSALLGGITLTGGQIRSLFSLRSAAFTVQWDGENFVFDVTGYGHGVGMSQYGANAMAEQGRTFREILTWYYTDTTVDMLW